MKCQIMFYEKKIYIYIYITNLSSAEITQSVVKINANLIIYSEIWHFT